MKYETHNTQRNKRYGYARATANLCPISQLTEKTTKNHNLSPTLMLCNARSINNKTTTLQEYFMRHKVDLVCLTETWARKGETATLKETAPPGYSVLHQSWTIGRGGGVAILIHQTLSYRAPPSPNIPGIECIGLGLNSTEKLAIWLVYRSPSTSAVPYQGSWKLPPLGDYNTPKQLS